MMPVIVGLSFRLMAQSCSMTGSFFRHYSLPLPEGGFACETYPDDPNLGVMPHQPF